MGKKLIINGIILVFLILAGIKVSADVREDIDLVEKFQEVQNQEELNELKTVCEEKKYFEPNCAVADISIRLNEGEYVDVSECDKIQYSGIPYYGIFQKAKWEETINLHRSNCVVSINNWEGIIWDE